MKENWITRGGGQGWAGWKTGRGFTGGPLKPFHQSLKQANSRGEWARDEMDGFGEMIWTKSGTSYAGSWQR